MLTFCISLTVKCDRELTFLEIKSRFYVLFSSGRKAIQQMLFLFFFIMHLTSIIRCYLTFYPTCCTAKSSFMVLLFSWSHGARHPAPPGDSPDVTPAAARQRVSLAFLVLFLLHFFYLDFEKELLSLIHTIKIINTLWVLSIVDKKKMH